MSQNKTLREEFEKFLKDNEAGWCDENADGDKFYDPDFDAVADFFIDKMRERLEKIQQDVANGEENNDFEAAKTYYNEVKDLLDYLK